MEVKGIGGPENLPPKGFSAKEIGLIPTFIFKKSPSFGEVSKKNPSFFIGRKHFWNWPLEALVKKTPPITKRGEKI